MNSPIYKIMDRAAWESFQAAGSFAGAPVDLADGYIHFSARHQVAGTLAKHFAGRADLWLITVAPERLEAGSLKWEVSRGGDLFPHLYAILPLAAVIEASPLDLEPDGRHVTPWDADNAGSAGVSG